MGISDTEKVSRKDSVGASDVPAILGISPFRTAADIYLEKTANLADSDLSDSMAIKVGETVELSLVQYGYEQAKEHYLEPITKLDFDYKVVSKSGAPKHANLDGLAYAEDGTPWLVVEAKTSSMPEHWGPSGSQTIPAHVMAQVQFQMGITGVTKAVVSTLLSAYRLELRTYLIEFDEEVFRFMCETVDDFWFGYVETRTRPPLSLPNKNTLELVRREHGKETQISDQIFSGLELAREEMASAKRTLDECQRAVIAELDDCEIGVCSHGTVTYREQSRKAYTVKATTHRVLRTKKPKKDKEE